ncbi:MAG TPA: hypothetical protein VK956_17425, partial [Verrucomicrobium sp.]|nr:hypothetical protein [Verrucomicrobium sp.]
DRLPGVADQCEATFMAWLNQDQVRPRQQLIMERVLCNRLEGPGARKVMARMLAHPSGSVRQQAWKIAANSSVVPEQGSWIPPLEAALAEAAGSPGRQEVLPALLGVITRIKNVRFDAALQMLAGNAALPVTLRLKAMSAQSSGEKGLSNEGFLFLNQLAGDPMNTTARIEAVRMLAATKLTDVQLAQVLEGVPYFGPLELAELLKGLRKYSRPEQGMLITKALTGSPLLGGFQESTFRTLCSVWPPEAYALLEPALARAQAAVEVKKRQLERLASEVHQKGRPDEGRKHFEQGKGTCIACHKADNVGRAIGPDLSKIGAIRRERDLLESILFPSATLARDYEAHAIETSDGQSFTGLIRSHTAEGLLLVDLAGQEKNVPHASIVAQTTLTTSLMPMGLDQTMTEQELCDLVAWLLSLK